MAVPEGYFKLPIGAKCACFEQYSDKSGRYCCGKIHSEPSLRDGLDIGQAELGLAAIKAREVAVREAIARGDNQVEIGQFAMGQLGLFPIYGDRQGRLWRQEGGVLTKVRDAKLVL